MSTRRDAKSGRSGVTAWDVAFDPWWRTLPGTAAREIADLIAERVTAAQQRTRKRSKYDEEVFRSLIDAVVANLLRRWLSDAARDASGADEDTAAWLRLPLSARRLKAASQSRYGRSPMPLGTLMNRSAREPGIVEHMRFLRLIDLDKAPRYSGATRASRIRCGAALLELIDRLLPSLGELRLQSVAETPDGLRVEPESIELRHRGENGGWSGGQGNQMRPRGTPIEYSDTEQTRAWREQMSEINAALAAATISYVPVNPTGDSNAAGKTSGEASSVAVHDRRLTRIFNNGRFDHGGRLYGGFWQGMKRHMRRGIRIDGHPVVSLDFSAMFLQLLYAVKAGKQAPLEGDLYEGIDPLEGWPEDQERKLAMRDAIKRNVNAMLFAKHDQPYRLVNGTKVALSRGMTRATLEKRIQARHPDIEQYLRAPGIGFELMFHESEIMMSVLLRCLKQGVVVLPLHDGLLVSERDQLQAREAMDRSFHDHTGFVPRTGH